VTCSSIALTVNRFANGLTPLLRLAAAVAITFAVAPSANADIIFSGGAGQPMTVNFTSDLAFTLTSVPSNQEYMLVIEDAYGSNEPFDIGFFPAAAGTPTLNYLTTSRRATELRIGDSGGVMARTDVVLNFLNLSPVTPTAGATLTITASVGTTTGSVNSQLPNNLGLRNVFLMDFSGGQQRTNTLQTTISVIPEPSTTAMALAAIACCGVLMRWRKRRPLLNGRDRMVRCFAVVVTLCYLALPRAAEAGTLYVADRINNVVATYDGTTGAVINSSFITGLNNPWSMTRDGEGNFYVTNRNSNAVGKYAPDGTVINASFISASDPMGVAVDNAGRLFLSVGSNVRTYNATTGALINSSFISGLNSPRPLALDGAGNLFVGDYFGSTVGKYDATTGAAVNASLITGFPTPLGLAFDATGKLFVSSLGNPGVQSFDASTGTAISGSRLGGFGNTFGLAFDESNNFFVSRYFDGFVAKLTATGSTVTSPLITLSADGPTSLVYVGAVPEPSTVAMALAGVACGGFSMWRRRKRIRHGGAMLLVVAAACVATLALPNAHAASIAWGTPQTISGDSDVSGLGSLVYAYNVGPSPAVSSTVSIGGVAFQPFPIINFPATNSFTFGNVTISESPGLVYGYDVSNSSGSYGALSPSYRALLNGGGGAGYPDTVTVSLAGLSAGQQYLFQWWASNAANIPQISSVTAAATNSITLDSNLIDAAGGLGQFVTGTFTADGATQDITFTGAATSPLINAFQIRAVPEPATCIMALAGIACGGFSMWRRKPGRGSRAGRAVSVIPERVLRTARRARAGCSFHPAGAQITVIAIAPHP